jgi:hypothetical protein
MQVRPIDDEELADLIARATKAREVALASRPAPGPTYVSNEDTAIGTSFGASGQSHSISLQAGVPYTARDDIEAQMLADAEQHGTVRRVSRQQAYRLRMRGGTTP